MNGRMEIDNPGWLVTGLIFDTAFQSFSGGRYGVVAATPVALQDTAKALLGIAKAFKLNLTSSLLMPSMLDDPHAAFNGGLMRLFPPNLFAQRSLKLVVVFQKQTTARRNRQWPWLITVARTMTSGGFAVWALRCAPLKQASDQCQTLKLAYYPAVLPLSGPLQILAWK